MSGINYNQIYKHNMPLFNSGKMERKVMIKQKKTKGQHSKDGILKRFKGLPIAELRLLIKYNKLISEVYRKDKDGDYHQEFEVQTGESDAIHNHTYVMTIKGRPYLCEPDDKIWCGVCEYPKRQGMGGHWYCPDKHGDGTGEHGIINQPKSKPRY